MSVRNLKVMPLPILSCDLGNRNSIFSLKFQLCMCAKLFQLLANSATLWTLGSQNPLSNGFSTQKYWSGLPCPAPGDLPDPGIKLKRLKRQTRTGRWVLSVQCSCSVVSDSLQPHESQHARPPCPSPTPGVHSDSRPSSQWCYPAIRVVSSAYLRLLIFLPAILIPASASSSPALPMMYSAYKLNKQGDNIQPWRTPFPTWNQSGVPCPVLTVASWPAYKFLKRQFRCSGIPISFRIFHSLLWSTQSSLNSWLSSECL